MTLRTLLALSIALLIVISAPEARADCSTPTASESATDFDFTNHILRYCDGTDWVVLGGGIPTGTIAAFAATSCPSGWTEYTSARGRFLRGIDNGAGNDPDGTRSPSAVQTDAFQAHKHTYTTPSQYDDYVGGSGTSARISSTGQTTGYAADGANGTPRTASETRPKNVAVLFCQYQGGAPLVAKPSGAAGAIQFADGSGGLTSDANIVVSGGNVGIGTTSPTVKFEVHDATNNVGMEVESGSNFAFTNYKTSSGASVVGRGTGLYLTNYDNVSMAFSTNSTTRMTITGDGNVGIGTTSPEAPLDVASAGIRLNASRTISSTDNAQNLILYGGTAGNGANIELYGASHSGSPNYVVLDGDTILLRSQSGSQRMRIDSTATYFYQSDVRLTNIPSGSGTRPVCWNSSSGALTFGNPCTTSARRYKENIQPLSYGLDEVLKFRPVFFSYRREIDPDSSRKVGFIAEEMNDIVPEVTFWSKGQIESIDYAKLTAVLTHAIQELKADNDTLRTEVKAANDNQAAQIEALREEVERLKAAR